MSSYRFFLVALSIFVRLSVSSFTQSFCASVSHKKNAISLNAMVTTGTLFALVAAIQGLIAARFAKSSETDSLAMISAKLLVRLFALLMIELVAIITLVCAFFFA